MLIWQFGLRFALDVCVLPKIQAFHALIAALLPLIGSIGITGKHLKFNQPAGDVTLDAVRLFFQIALRKKENAMSNTMINLHPSNLIENDSLTQELAAEVRVKLWQAKNVTPAETGTEAAQIQALREMTLEGAELV